MSTYEIELPEIRYDHDTYDGPTVTIDIDEAPFPGTEIGRASCKERV